MVMDDTAVKKIISWNLTDTAMEYLQGNMSCIKYWQCSIFTWMQVNEFEQDSLEEM